MLLGIDRSVFSLPFALTLCLDKRLDTFELPKYYVGYIASSVSYQPYQQTYTPVPSIQYFPPQNLLLAPLFNSPRDSHWSGHHQNHVGLTGVQIYRLKVNRGRNKTIPAQSSPLLLRTRQTNVQQKALRSLTACAHAVLPLKPHRQVHSKLRRDCGGDATPPETFRFFYRFGRFRGARLGALRLQQKW